MQSLCAISEVFEFCYTEVQKAIYDYQESEVVVRVEKQQWRKGETLEATINLVHYHTYVPNVLCVVGEDTLEN